MSHASQHDEGQESKPDEEKKNEPRKSYCGVPLKERPDDKVVHIDLERQQRGRNGR